MLAIKLVALGLLVAYGYGMGQYSDLNWFGTLIAASFFITAPILYFMPTIEANRRESKSTGSVALLNLLLGWTLIGWIAAMLWAMRDATPEQKAAIEADSKTCPHCAETVKAAAKVCKHCHGVLTPPVAASTPPVAVSGAPDNATAMMAHYGITFKQDKYWFGQYAYDNLADAVNYANKQSATAV